MTADYTKHTAGPSVAPPSGTACSCGAHAGDEMLTLAEVAELLRVPVATLRYWRHLGAGPRSFRIGRFVRYWRSEVVAWLDRQTLLGRGH